MFFVDEVVCQHAVGGAKIADVEPPMIIIYWHDERNMLDTELMMFTEHVDEALTHITVDTALDGVVNRWNAALNLKENVKEPFGIGIEMLPVGDEHIITDSGVAVVHRLLKSRNILR